MYFWPVSTDARARRSWNFIPRDICLYRSSRCGGANECKPERTQRGKSRQLFLTEDSLLLGGQGARSVE
jgi:hypothetical protein